MNISLLLIVYFLFDDFSNPKGHTLIASYTTWPLFFGLALFSFGGVGVALPIENELADPDQMLGWTGVLHVHNWFLTAFYIGIGFFGYLKYGDETAGSITLNLPFNNL